VEWPDYADKGAGDKSLHECQSFPRCIVSYLWQRKGRVVAESPFFPCVCVCFPFKILMKPTDLNENRCILKRYFKKNLKLF